MADLQLPHQRFALLDLILCEVLQGIGDPVAFAEISKELLTFQAFQAGGTKLAIAAASNFRDLRSRGYPVRKTVDCRIATFCLRSNHELLHRDRDFDIFERTFGLRVIHL